VIRRLAIPAAIALPAGVAATLTLDAATRNPRHAIVVALAAVWLLATATLTAVLTRRPR
jgi:hypothetical protein